MAAKNRCRIKSGDEVIVITGADKGTVGKVVEVIPAARQVVVEGVRRVRRHRRPVGDTPGAIVDKEMPIDISNVALWDAANKKRIRVGYRVEGDRKIRIDRATGAALDKE